MGAPSKYVNLEIRGVVYANAAEAGRKLGVGAQAVRQAARAGTLHRVGLREKGKEPMRVMIAGQTFDSAQVAAAHFGVTPGAVWNAIWEGDPDRIARERPAARPNAKPIEIGGLRFASMAECGRELGFSVSYVSLAFRRNSAPMKEALHAAAMRLVAEREGHTKPKPSTPRRTRRAAVPVVIGGLPFASRADAARVLGCERWQVRDAVSGRSKRWREALEYRAAELRAELEEREAA